MTRQEAENLYGPIKTSHVFPPIPIRNSDYCVYFDQYMDLDCPFWVQAWGETEAQAIATLLEQAEEHRLDSQADDMFKLIETIDEHRAQRRAERIDALRLADLERDS